MNLDEMSKAIEDAEVELRKADMIAADLANLLQGRLRQVSKSYHPRIGSYTRQQILRKLKRELKDFNSVTGQWKS